jgi:probable rRNA maturation factor
MSLDVSVSAEGVRTPVSRARLADAARVALRGEGVRSALVSITLLTRRGIAAMNRKHLEHTGPTDVISFGFARASDHDPVVGDIYIAPEVASANAHGANVPVREEMVRLVVHGVLHVLGYDHPDADREQSEMWKRQERYVRAALRTRARERGR